MTLGEAMFLRSELHERGSLLRGQSESPFRL